MSHHKHALYTANCGSVSTMEPLPLPPSKGMKVE